MKISNVQIFLINEAKLKAYATITLEDAFLVRDLKVIEGHSGLFVAMPAKKRRDGVFRDVAHPLNKEMRSHLEESVLKAYEEALETQPESLEGSENSADELEEATSVG